MLHTNHIAGAPSFLAFSLERWFGFGSSPSPRCHASALLRIERHAYGRERTAPPVCVRFRTQTRARNIDGHRRSTIECGSTFFTICWPGHFILPSSPLPIACWSERISNTGVVHFMLRVQTAAKCVCIFSVI
uniref:Uncharacterized protein n=1 Tax=Anopheles minimus TaxID=112268 RepID=A0A182WMX0_9DIPT